MKTLGILLLVFTILIWVADKIVYNATQQHPKPIDLVKGPQNIYLVIGLILGLLLSFNPMVYNPDGYRTYVQDPIFGVEKVMFNPGWKWGGFLRKTQAWPDVMSTSFEEDNPVSIRFNDATQAQAQATVQWRLPNDPETMIMLHKSYRSPEILQRRTLTPYSRECLGFAAQLMESETHYSGGQSKLKEDFRDQLLNGQYVLETNISFIFDSVSNERVKITEVDIRLDQNGVAIRIPSDVQTFGIKADFAAVPHIDYEEMVDEKLKAKIDQSTKESIAKQTLITAEQEALTAAAEGRKLIAETKAKYEADKQKAVIEAEKAKDVAREQALQAKFIADKIEQEGRAKAAANQALVSAGLTPQERAEWDYKKHVDGLKALADGIKGADWPRVMTFGSETGVTTPMEAVGMEFLFKLSERASK